jgi:molybdopterin/thiamine biosynthesis adenylyltransferase
MRLILSPEQGATLTRELVELPPERLIHLVGRALNGDTYAVTELVIDVDAERSGSHCRPSANGQKSIQQAERDGTGSYIGIVHSHPQFSPEPSGLDAEAAANTLALNDHLNDFFVGVVTDARASRLPGHRTALGRGQLSMHVFSADDGNQLRPAQVSIGRDAAFLLELSRRIPPQSLSAVLGSRILIVGAGSVGSTMAEVLTRNGVGSLHLIDHDTVEAVNLSRTTYTTHDLGKTKVEALGDRLRAINPMLSVTSSDQPLDESSIDDVAQSVASADLVIAATDDPHAQAMLDHLLQRHDKPGMFVGVGPGGHLGEIVLVLPGLTTCYWCAAGRNRLHGAQKMDYSTGRVMGAAALGADVTAVAVLAAKIALELLGLLRGSDSSLERVLTEGRSMIQIGLSPETFRDYRAFEGIPNQHALQSLWLHPEPSDGCQSCKLDEVALSPQPTHAPTQRSLTAGLDPEVAAPARRSRPLAGLRHALQWFRALIGWRQIAAHRPVEQQLMSEKVAVTATTTSYPPHEEL